MKVVILLALLSLAAAQCSDSCNCGNSACCQDLPQSGGQFYNYYNQWYRNSQPYGRARQSFVKTSCLKTNPVPISLTQVYQNQPVFTRIIQDGEDSRQIDNVCSTLFPLPDDSSAYIVYDSTVYCDGSYSVRTTISHDIGIGTYIRGNAYSTFSQVIFASLGQNMFVGCTHNEYGDSSSAQVFATSLGSVSPLGPSCVQHIQNIIQCVGQDQGGLYVLPYRLPTRCVTQQVCSILNPLLYPNINYRF